MEGKCKGREWGNWKRRGERKNGRKEEEELGGERGKGGKREEKRWKVKGERGRDRKEELYVDLGK